jgi:membrane protein YqaA with SNARE-associated domain
MLRSLYNWTLSLSAHRRAPWALAAVSFAESSFFPIPPDVLLVPMALANPKRAWLLAGLCTIASVTGGLLGYAIGALLYDTIGQWLISLYGGGDDVEAFRRAYAEWGGLVILIKGLTPIPYKIVTIASGFTGYNLLWFTILSLITRAGRFFLMALLLQRYGEPVRIFIERRLEVVAALLFVVVVGGFVLAKYVI